MSLEEWRQAIITPAPYRFGNSTLRFQPKYVIIILIVLIICIMYIILPSGSREHDDNRFPAYSSDARLSNVIANDLGGKRASLLFAKTASSYHNIYPLTKPVSTEKGLQYNIGIVSDLDVDSKTTSGKWVSYFRRGYLYIQRDSGKAELSKVSIEWEHGEPRTIKSTISSGDRGMELSELVVFNGKLYACDDRTGIIFEIPYDDSSAEIQPIPWVILSDGNGTSPKTFKCEWATVKDEHLWVGGFGKDWTTSEGEVVNYDPKFVKKISVGGEVVHLNWRANYDKLSSEMGIHFPGYVIHESVSWSDAIKRWIFLPRKVSSEQYNAQTDERKGTNKLVTANDDFSNIKVSTVGEVVPTHGFSSFKFIPDTDDKLIVALKSEEVDGKTATFIMVFDLNGNILLPETKVGDHKYEGLEFL